VVIPDAAPEPTSKGATVKLSKNQQSYFDILLSAGSHGLELDDWNAKAREIGLGVKRKADLFDFRRALQSRGLIYQIAGRWHVQHQSKEG